MTRWTRACRKWKTIDTAKMKENWARGWYKGKTMKQLARLSRDVWDGFQQHGRCPHRVLRGGHEFRTAAQGRTIPEAPQQDAALLEHDGVHRGAHLTFTGRNCRSDDPKCAAGGGVPCTRGFRDQRKESNSLVGTKLGRVLVVALHLGISSRRADRYLCCLGQRLRPLKACDGKVKCSRSPIQAWQVDVSRTSASHPSFFTSLG